MWPCCCPVHMLLAILNQQNVIGAEVDMQQVVESISLRNAAGFRVFPQIIHQRLKSLRSCSYYVKRSCHPVAAHHILDF